MNGHMVDDAVVVLARSPDCVIHWISDSVSAAPCCECVCVWFRVLRPLASWWDLHLAATKLLKWKACNRCTVRESQILVTENCGTVESKRRPRNTFVAGWRGGVLSFVRALLYFCCSEAGVLPGLLQVFWQLAKLFQYLQHKTTETMHRGHPNLDLKKPRSLM